MLPSERSPLIPLSRAFLWILLWTLIISGSAWMGWLYFIHIREQHRHNDQYQIVALVQSCPQKETLKTIYLAELLHLSLDKPANLYCFDVQAGEEMLLASPLIKEVAIKKIRPGTLYVNYTMRAPIAYLGDYTNTAVDSEGSLFPFSPFFTPKNLPVLYLGLTDTKISWGESLVHDERLKPAFSVLNEMQKVFPDAPFSIKKIDVSRAFAESDGKREIIISLEEQREYNKQGKLSIVAEPSILRLNPDDFQINLLNYKTLYTYLANKKKKGVLSKDFSSFIIKKPDIIDFRLSQLAFIKRGN